MLNLLLDLKEQFGLTYLFISHDLNVVEHVADRVLVMYLGKVAEVGPVDAIFPARPIPIRGRCWPAARRWIRTRRRTEPPLRRRSRPIRSIRPPAAVSVPAARMARRSAASGALPWSAVSDGHARPAEAAPASGHSRSLRDAQGGRVMEPLVRARDLHVSFVSRDATISAVNGIDLDLAPKRCSAFWAKAVRASR